LAVDVRRFEHGGEPDFVTGLEWLFEAPGSRPPGWDRLLAEQRAAEVIASPHAALFGSWSSDGQLVGIASVYLDILSVRFGQRASIEDLAVHSTWRSRGVGATLLSSVKKWAIDQGADYVFLESGLARTQAHRFYIREGAVQTASAFRWTIRQPSQ
jgi:GNAT superfamily N-acetyltransferase